MTEREVAYNLFSALNHGVYAAPPKKRPPPRTSSAGAAYRPGSPARAVHRPLTAGVRTSVPANYYDPRAENQYINTMAKSMGR